MSELRDNRGDADADAVSGKTICRRRENDLKFLAAIREAKKWNDLPRLTELERETAQAIEAAEARGSSGPRWRAIVIARAIVHVIGR